MPGIRNSILETIGDTPVVRINRLAPEGVELYAKLEAFNPLGSVKDRLALGVIEAAERDGALEPGQTVIEATSGNTGIGLAMVCAQKGYPLVIVMAENFSVERRKMMRFLGARVVLTPAAEKGTGMIEKARELAQTHGWFWCRQFENAANPGIHAHTTAREIVRDFHAHGLDWWVSGFGTGGTLQGVARVLRRELPGTLIAAAEPDNSAMLASGIAQAYRADGTPAASHASFRPHIMQGWAPDFIPKLVSEALEARLVDRVVPVAGAEALRLARELARREGIFCGISGGATLAAALEVARTAPRGARILCMIPDTGERYLSTPLFAEIGEDMSAEEMEIATSTPSCRFDAASVPSARPAAASEPTPAAVALVEEAIRDSNKVVMFALEWCEFCWCLRRLFADMGIPFRSIDLDSANFRKDDFGGQVRAALRKRVGTPTIPQVFFAGTHLGGCTETLHAVERGELQRLLAEKGVPFRSDRQVEARAYLPKWLQRKPA